MFSGDFLWEGFFGQYFNRSYPYSSLNVNDLDTHDLAAKVDLFREAASLNFTLLLGHLIGIDHAGHTFGGDNEHLERKILEIEAIIAKIIDSLDNETVIMVYGDHGMTP